MVYTNIFQRLLFVCDCCTFLRLDEHIITVQSHPVITYQLKALDRGGETQLQVGEN